MFHLLWITISILFSVICLTIHTSFYFCIWLFLICANRRRFVKVGFLVSPHHIVPPTLPKKQLSRVTRYTGIGLDVVQDLLGQKQPKLSGDNLHELINCVIHYSDSKIKCRSPSLIFPFRSITRSSYTQSRRAQGMPHKAHFALYSNSKQMLLPGITASSLWWRRLPFHCRAVLYNRRLLIHKCSSISWIREEAEQENSYWKGCPSPRTVPMRHTKVS